MDASDDPCVLSCESGLFHEFADSGFHGGWIGAVDAAAGNFPLGFPRTVTELADENEFMLFCDGDDVHPVAGAAGDEFVYGARAQTLVVFRAQSDDA